MKLWGSRRMLVLRLRRRPLYPTELRGHISHFHAQGAVLPLGAKALSCQVAGTGRQSGGGTPHTAAALPLPDAMPDGRTKTDSIVLSIPGSVNRLFAPPRRPASRQSGSIPGARRAAQAPGGKHTSSTSARSWMRQLAADRS